MLLLIMTSIDGENVIHNRNEYSSLSSFAVDTSYDIEHLNRVNF